MSFGFQISTSRWVLFACLSLLPSPLLVIAEVCSSCLSLQFFFEFIIFSQAGYFVSLSKLPFFPLGIGYETQSSVDYVAGYFFCVCRDTMWFSNSIKDPISERYVLFG